jgi:hypothetical protein
MQRPDFSNYVVHFTKDAAPASATKSPNEVAGLVGLSAKERLFGILSERRIFATRMPWTNRPAVCFTECTWHSLFSHAQLYSRFGIGFRKEMLFARGGGPAIYLAPHLLEKQQAHVGADEYPFDPLVYAFATPFAPPYASTEYKAKHWNGRNPIDYTHEREWRVPHELAFELSDVAFVIVDTYEDMAHAPAEFKDAIGRDNWLLMSNYQKIEELWPVHQMP